MMIEASAAVVIAIASGVIQGVVSVVVVRTRLDAASQRIDTVHTATARAHERLDDHIVDHAHGKFTP